MNITESEQKILSLLWEYGVLSTMEITKKLESETEWTKHAVISFLKRMETKGLVEYKEEGRAKYYTARVSKDEVASKERVSLLDTFYQGKVGLMISEMVSNKSLTQQEVGDLRKLLDELYREEE